MCEHCTKTVEQNEAGRRFYAPFVCDAPCNDVSFGIARDADGACYLHYEDDECGHMGDTPITVCPACGQPLTEPKALTLEELRERDGRPVWIESTGAVILRHLPKWTIAEFYNIVDNYDPSIVVCECFRVASGRGLKTEDYGKTWTAYDHPPKEGPRRENTRKTCATCKSLYVKDFAVGVCEHPGSGKTTVRPKDGCECWEERL